MAKQRIKVIREEMLQVANNVAQEKNIDKDSVFEAMEQALEKSARVKYGQERDIRVSINRDTGDIKLNSYLEVVEKLSLIKPPTLGAALRISGVTPAAVIALLRHVKRKKNERSA